MKKRLFLFLTILIGFVGWHCFVMAQTIPVTQAERVTLTLKLVNIGEIPSDSSFADI